MKTLVKAIAITAPLLCGQVLASEVGFSSSTVEAGINDTFTIDIVGSSFTGNVDGGGVNLSFDSSVINVVSVTIDESVWDFGGFGISTGTIDNVTGTIDGIMVNTFGDVTGDFVIATLELTAVGTGTSSLVLSDYALNPWASGGQLLDPLYVDGSVNVSATVVPIPASVWLFGSGLAGLAGVIRRRKV